MDDLATHGVGVTGVTNDPTPASEVLPVSEVSQVRAWLMAIRLPTLVAAFAPVAVGTAVVHWEGGVDWWPALAALMGALWIQVGTNLVNDVFDHEKGADASDRLGPVRVVQSGLISGRSIKRAAVFCFGMALLTGAYLVYVAGWPILVVGLVSILCGYLYTGGPFPLAYNGLGDLFVFVFFGVVAVCGTVYVQLGAVTSLAWWAAVPVGTAAVAILVVNNLRDEPTDRRVGKRTLVVLFGRGFGLAQYAVMVLGTFVVPVMLVAQGKMTYYGLLPLAVLPRGALLVTHVFRRTGAELNPVLKHTAYWMWMVAALWAGALVLDAPLSLDVLPVSVGP